VKGFSTCCTVASRLNCNFWTKQSAACGKFWN